MEPTSDDLAEMRYIFEALDGDAESLTYSDSWMALMKKFPQIASKFEFYKNSIEAAQLLMKSVW